MVHLKYNSRDIGKVFKKPQWGGDLMFSWYDKGDYYGYCIITMEDDKEKIVFKHPYNESNRKAGYKVSRVGAGVLNCKLELIATIKEKKMSKRNVDYIGGEYNVVEVCLTSDPLEDNYYKIDADIAVSEGTTVVVETTYGYTLGHVVKYHKKDLDVKTMKVFNKAKAWVVDTIDDSRQKERREATERRGFIMKQLQEKKEAMEEVAIFKLLAESDPDAAKMLEELKKLGV